MRLHVGLRRFWRENNIFGRGLVVYAAVVGLLLAIRGAAWLAHSP